MDFENLFWIAIVLFYFIFQLRGRKRAPEEAPPQSQPQRRREPQNEELDEALQEIRRALGWGDEEEKPRPPVPVKTIPEPMLPPPRPQPQVTSTPAPPFSRETAFARQGETVVAPRIRKLAPVAAPKSNKRRAAIARLRDPELLRQEFLIREILGPPVSLRRR